LDNAILHGGEGKYLSIRLKQGNDSVQIEIEDRGKGIPPDELKHVFDPFYRVDRGRPSDGLGIGLTLANAIVKQHGGTIEVSSIPYVRNVFRVILPAG
jgi:signal transduction histidine kinase